MADEDESRRKRIKMSNGDSGSESLTAPVQGLVGATTDAGSPAPDAQAVKEAEVGITQFVSPDLPGFSGVVKKRYVVVDRLAGLGGFMTGRKKDCG